MKRSAGSVELPPAFCFPAAGHSPKRPLDLLRVISNLLLQSLRTVFNDMQSVVQGAGERHQEKT